jgi:NAD(P)-dependent dehydrogenase (short-subunit alcohol dehydrogenase family)
MNHNSRAGESCVITGGAGGIGKASALLWLQHGGTVVVADVDDQAGMSFQNEYPRQIKFVHCDTRKRKDLELAIQTAKQMGSFTCMFSNAGVGANTDNVQDALTNWDVMKRIVDINVNACSCGTLLALKHFDPEKGGTAIITASMAGLLPVGAPPIYSMTKAANLQFIRAIGSALGEHSNKRVYALCPSYTATNLGPDPAIIKAALGGVLQAKHQADGFWMLAQGDLPQGSVMRVTARRRGTLVVHDLMQYGKELGGVLKPREGKLIQSAPLEEYTGPMKRASNSFGNVSIQNGKL